MGESVTKEALKETFDSLDTDGSGELDFEEFKQILTSVFGLEQK